jgi:hypothetical protein
VERKKFPARESFYTCVRKGPWDDPKTRTASLADLKDFLPREIKDFAGE